MNVYMFPIDDFDGNVLPRNVAVLFSRSSFVLL